ncbi:hypothetical protein EDB89DRAFT_1903987 [Lactarius sanguifluus]|nr:hypothetical protein EDB89DRAFT_1903987 [Lactarius sanguifluus]
MTMSTEGERKPQVTHAVLDSVGAGRGCGSRDRTMGASYYNVLAKAVRVDPLLLMTLLDALTTCCHLQRLLTFLYVPLLGTTGVNCDVIQWAHVPQVDPMYAPTFIRTFLNILIEYLGEETLDVGGHPVPNRCAISLHHTSATSVTGVSGPSRLSMNNLKRNHHRAAFSERYTAISESPVRLFWLLLAYDLQASTNTRPASQSEQFRPSSLCPLQGQVPFTLRTSFSVIDHGDSSFLPAPDNHLTTNTPTGALEDVAVEPHLGCAGPSPPLPPPSPVPSVPPWCRAGPRRWGAFASGDARVAQISPAPPAGALLSALKIDQLQLSGETYKPYKGCSWARIGR